jgi:hypothetical protein
LISYVVAATLGVLYLIALRRLRRSPLWQTQGYLLAVAALSALTLLPVYHRFCDIGILLLTVPWVAREFSQKPRWQALLSTPLLGLLYFSWERRMHLDRLAGIQLTVVQFLYYRGDALLVALFACVLLSAMYASQDQKHHEAQ